MLTKNPLWSAGGYDYSVSYSDRLTNGNLINSSNSSMVCLAISYETSCSNFGGPESSDICLCHILTPLQELQRDQQRLATVQHNARILEERDRQVRLLEEQQRRPPPIPERSLDRATPTPQAPKPSPARPKPTSTSTDYQPEQWTPAASRR
jgi:hypothetical protein